MATQRQIEIEQEFRRALEDCGEGTDTDLLIAATSERTMAEPDEIIEALAYRGDWLNNCSGRNTAGMRSRRRVPAAALATVTAWGIHPPRPSRISSTSSCFLMRFSSSFSKHCAATLYVQDEIGFELCVVLMYLPKK